PGDHHGLPPFPTRRSSDLRDTVEIYPNGISTSLPEDVQVALVRSIRGLEEAEIMRPGYAVEYDFVPPTELKPTLETKRVSGLFQDRKSTRLNSSHVAISYA